MTDFLGISKHFSLSELTKKDVLTISLYCLSVQKSRFYKNQNIE